MSENKRRPRIAVVSPFLDKGYGTERTVIEWLSHLPDDFEVHLYSQRVEDLPSDRFIWHRIPSISAPGLVGFLWWFAANHISRAWDSRVRKLDYDLVYSPGINCFDADVISVHIVFAEFLRQTGPELKFRKNHILSWPRLLHRRIYYALIIALEKRVYTNSATQLVLYARKTARDLERFYGRGDRLPILYLGLDQAVFNPARRIALRDSARQQLGLASNRFTLLLVGNDLRKKGISVLLRALNELSELPVDLLVVGREDPAPFQAVVHSMGLNDRVHFLPPRKDVDFYYAAADIYTGPSLEDTFALPPAEAMACGLPVIVSAENGTSEIITHETDGLILKDSSDSITLAAMILRLFENADFRARLGENAWTTARQYTWERNGRDLAEVFHEALRRKSQSTGQTLTQLS
jgi:UDP-glucose:(heptosyl)LPS alpha-1,3-glucosyltransferase